VATIINKLEVVLEQPVAKAGVPPPTPPKAPPLPLAPYDVEDILERQARTAIRLAAH
jgi:hypothetical protein